MSKQNKITNFNLKKIKAKIKEGASKTVHFPDQDDSDRDDLDSLEASLGLLGLVSNLFKILPSSEAQAKEQRAIEQVKFMERVQLVPDYVYRHCELIADKFRQTGMAMKSNVAMVYDDFLQRQRTLDNNTEAALEAAHENFRSSLMKMMPPPSVNHSLK